MSKRKAPQESPNEGITDFLTGRCVRSGGVVGPPSRSHRGSPRRAGQLRAQREPGHSQVQRVQVLPPSPPPVPAPWGPALRRAQALTVTVPQESSLRDFPVPQQDTERGRSQEAGGCWCPGCRRGVRGAAGGGARCGAGALGKRREADPAYVGGAGREMRCGCCGAS